MTLSVIAAFAIILVILAVGEFVSIITKAFVPSVFVSALLFLFGFWTFLPADLIVQGSFATPVVYLAMYLLLTHMGTLMSVRELLSQWRTVLIALAGNIGICIVALTIGRIFFGWQNVIAATPPLTGGVVASILMSNAANEKGLAAVAVLATCTYIMQGFFGYPVTAWMLKKEGQRLVNLLRTGQVTSEQKPKSLGAMAVEKKSKYQIFPPLPERFRTTYAILLKLGLVAWLAFLAAPITHVNVFVLCLIFGVIGREIGFLEPQALNKANAFGWLMTALMAFIFANLAQATPEMLVQIVGPLFGLIIIGIIGMAIFSMLVGKLLGYSKEMAFSIAMTALYGFPADYILTIEAVKSVTGSDEEYEYAINNMLPKMLVGGFTTVTITSVVLAGFFVKLL
ncbi:MAG: hypothetical protein ACOWWO_03070 [Peptococcaceae bacterium]